MPNTEENGEIIQYVPFMSFVHPSFWHTLTEMKLDVDKLTENTKQIYGRFSYRGDIGPVFEVDCTSFNKSPETEQYYENVTGTLMNKNTIEDFKAIDKAALLNSVGEIVWANIKKKTWISNPTCLVNFVILSFADLKKFHYYYWFAFAAPSQPTVYLFDKSKQLEEEFNNKNIDDLCQSFKLLDQSQKNFFVTNKDNDIIKLHTLAEIFKADMNVQNLDIDLCKNYFTFIDPSDGGNPGWPLRIFLAALLEHCPGLAGSDIKAIGLRFNANGAIESSRIFSIKIPQNVKAVESAGWVGWERNDKGNFGPKLANMSASMDPVKLADTSSDLNIKLMKWRLVPNLDVHIMKKTKCLLLGAGTLGCHVARDLLAWGFRHITFMDSGKVSFSNPTRQVLFNYQDCLAGGRRKAEAAAGNLRLILPTVKSQGIVAHIPMPGHPVGESLKEETIANIKTITEAIADHDVVFLLLDTREARWLPSVIAAHYGKIVINAALGFDSYLVMRHGIFESDSTEEGGACSVEGGDSGSVGGASDSVGGASGSVGGASVRDVSVPGEKLACYFCNDVTAPGNSLRDRTLDQQCTVTRPAGAAVAGALAVELLVALLQHPLRAKAPAAYNLTSDSELPEDLQGILGPIPHSIRGFLHSHQTVTPTCAKFKQCVACSDAVVNQYRENGVEFLLKVFNSGTYLEEVTGLSELHLTAEMTDILTFSDEDD